MAERKTRKSKASAPRGAGRGKKKAPVRKSRANATPAARAEDFRAATTAGLEQIIDGLHRLYPDADCELDFEDPLQLLVATILSAQSTDKMINQVTAELFQRYRTVQEFADADPAEFEKEIKSTGFFRNKTKSVLGAARKLVDDYGGEVPQSMDELVTLPGVPRKTANVVLGTAFGKPEGVVVDTHVKRLAYRLGLSDQTDPAKVERDLMTFLPRDEWIFLGHALIWHGRRVCHARRPDCEACELRPYCPRNGI